jgi:hypothetical protein
MAHVRWSKGGDADVVAFDGDRITLRSTVPSAPGTPLDGVLASGAGVRVKVHGCRREGDAFVIAGRMVDLRRETRAEVTALVPRDVT